MANPNKALERLRSRKTSTVEETLCLSFGEQAKTIREMKSKYPAPRYTVRSSTKNVRYGRGVCQTRVRQYWVRVYDRE